MRRAIFLYVVAMLANGCAGEFDEPGSDDADGVRQVSEGLTHPTAVNFTKTHILQGVGYKDTVTIRWGYDYGPPPGGHTHTGHLRAFVVMGSSLANTHLQADSLVLGNTHMPLTATSGNRQDGSLSLETPAVNCDPNSTYRTHLQLSIRWSDGTLLRETEPENLETAAAAICN